MDHTFQPYLLMMLSSLKNNNGNESVIMQYLPFMIILGPILMNILPFREIKEYILNYFKNDNLYISINIPSHEVPVIRSYSTTPVTKNIYSDTFLAITNYLLNNNLVNIDSLTEIMSDNIDLNNNYYEYKKENKYIFIPLNNNKILVSKEYDIYCEFNNSTNKSEDDDDDNNKKNNNKTAPDFKLLNKKNYLIILSIKKTNKNNSIIILKKFIDECVIEYRKSMEKKSDNKLYIYEYKNSEKSESSLELNFNEYLMEHNKDLKTNIFFEGKDKLINYINPFIYDSSDTINIGEEKYKKSGFTFKAGLLFYGSPGCGKTSTIKAISKYTNRNPIIVNLNKIKTCEELEGIFRKRNFNGKELCGKQLCYVLEDCDAFDDNIISSRNKKENTKNTKDIKKDETNSELTTITKLLEATCVVDIKNNHDTVNLSCFLNILDGIVELHGVMIIMTTNYPEKIDSALIRPGRFDFKYQFKRASKDIIKEMIAFKFDLTEKQINQYNDILNIKDEILSPAEVQSICFQNDNVVNCINEIVLESQNKKIDN